MSSGPSTTEPSWTIRGLFREHKLGAYGLTAVLVVMLALIIVPFLASGSAAVSDATTCTQWGSSNQSQQAAYARLYISEHGPGGRAGNTPAGVIAAINNGCMQAYTDDVSDNVTVVQAISGNF